MSKIEMDAVLADAGSLDGSVVKVAVEIVDLWLAVESKHIAEEVRERLANGDDVIQGLAGDFEDDEPLFCDEGEDELFLALDPWNRAELLKAIREDDGRRAIDVLKRAAG